METEDGHTIQLTKNSQVLYVAIKTGFWGPGALAGFMLWCVHHHALMYQYYITSLDVVLYSFQASNVIFLKGLKKRGGGVYFIFLEPAVLTGAPKPVWSEGYIRLQASLPVGQRNWV